MTMDDDEKKFIYSGGKDDSDKTLDLLKDEANGGFNVYISLLDEEKCFTSQQAFCDSEVSKASDKCDEGNKKLNDDRIADQEQCIKDKQSCIDDSNTAQEKCDK